MYSNDYQLQISNYIPNTIQKITGEAFEATSLTEVYSDSNKPANANILGYEGKIWNITK